MNNKKFWQCREESSKVNRGPQESHRAGFWGTRNQYWHIWGFLACFVPFTPTALVLNYPTANELQKGDKNKVVI